MGRLPVRTGGAASTEDLMKQLGTGTGGGGIRKRSTTARVRQQVTF